LPARASAGLALALLANFALTSADAAAKALTSRYPVFQVIAMEVSFALIPVAIMLLRRRALGRLDVQNWPLVVMRGLFAGLGTACSFYAYSRLPLSEVYAIVFCAPILVTLASIPLLGEQVGRYRLGAVVLGFFGILVMVQPGATQVSLAHAAALAAMLTTALAILIMRRAHREEPAVMVAAVMLGLLAVSVPGSIFIARLPSESDLSVAAIAGLMMGTGNFLLVEAVRRAPAAVIAPAQYTMLVWAILYSVLLFHDPLKTNVVLGAVIVVGSNLYIMHRERVRAGM
jgi:drug/metabolite transporter (DMT)-like permease